MTSDVDRSAERMNLRDIPRACRSRAMPARRSRSPAGREAPISSAFSKSWLSALGEGAGGVGAAASNAVLNRSAMFDSEKWLLPACPWLDGAANKRGRATWRFGGEGGAPL